MKRRAVEWQPGWFLDPRGALFLAAEETLVVADLHLGYSWAERARGNLMPVLDHDETASCFLEIVRDYKPRRAVVAGDIVHGSLTMERIDIDVRSILNAAAESCELVLVAGNHDHALARMLGRPLLKCFELDSCVIAHGDQPVESDDRPVIVGHEHPAVVLSDDPATHVRCPCFLVNAQAVVLPALSQWAAGTVYRGRPLHSPALKGIRFKEAYALTGRRLIPVSLP